MIRINSLQVKMKNIVRVLKYVEPCSFLFQMAVNLISKHCCRFEHQYLKCAEYRERITDCVIVIDKNLESSYNSTIFQNWLYNY